MRAVSFREGRRISEPSTVETTKHVFLTCFPLTSCFSHHFAMYFFPKEHEPPNPRSSQFIPSTNNPHQLQLPHQYLAPNDYKASRVCWKHWHCQNHPRRRGRTPRPRPGLEYQVERGAVGGFFHLETETTKRTRHYSRTSKCILVYSVHNKWPHLKIIEDFVVV